jgi:hypothetical protein
MLVRIYINPDESIQYELVDAYRNSINRIAHRLRIESDVQVDVVCFQSKRVFATFSPLKKSSFGIQPQSTDDRKQSSIIPPPPRMPSQYQHTSQPLSREDDSDPPPSFKEERIEITKINIVKRWRNDKP